MTITLRDTKGSALTYAELDANFTHADLYKSVQNITWNIRAYLMFAYLSMI